MRHSRADADRTGRREFLAQVSAAAASGLLLSARAGGAEGPAAPLPTIALGRYRVTRLIVGSNPISGYSYLGKEKDQEMKSYFTEERTLEFLLRCEREGINTHQFSPASKATEVYRQLRRQGSKMQLIGLHSKREDIKQMVEDLQPIGMAHHGGATDRLFREGHSTRVHDFVKAVHDAGLLAGVSAHNPDCIKRVADEGWEVDFFMTCFYYITRPHPSEEEAKKMPVLEGPKAAHTFYKNDPLAMCEVIRQVKQPCLGFKILGAGRLCTTPEAVREAFRFAFSHIKPTDAVIVGMYPRQSDQIRANVQYTREFGAAG